MAQYKYKWHAQPHEGSVSIWLNAGPFCYVRSINARELRQYTKPRAFLGDVIMGMELEMKHMTEKHANE